MHAPDFQTGILAGLWEFHRSLIVGARPHAATAAARTLALSIFESSIAVTEYIMFESFLRGDIMRRIGVNRFWPTFPVGIYETKQGWLGVTTVTPAQWRAFCEMLGLPDLATTPTLFMGVDRMPHTIDRGQIVPLLKQRTAQDWFAEGLRRMLPIVPVPEIADLSRMKRRGARRIRADHDRQRNRFHRPLHAAPDGTPPRRGGKVPGSAAAARHAPAALRSPATPVARADQNRLPLSGIRVIDFSMGWAGPLARAARRPRRRRGQGRGDLSTRTGGAASTAAGLRAGEVRESLCATAS